jgi:hypothetical protein
MKLSYNRKNKEKKPQPGIMLVFPLLIKVNALPDIRHFQSSV